METWPINRADFLIELTPLAAAIFRHSINKAMRVRTAAGYCRARLGVEIYEPVVRLTFVSRAQDAPNPQRISRANCQPVRDGIPGNNQNLRQSRRIEHRCNYPSP